MGFINKNIYFVLLLLPACASNENIVDIRDFGAIGDGKKLNTSAIQQAFDHCSEGGGGTVIFPAGEWLSGTLILKDRVSVHFESGAILKGSPNLSDYDSTIQMLVYGKNLHDIVIDGPGIIDGNGPLFWDQDFQALQRPMPWLRIDSSDHVIIRDLKLINSPSHTLRLQYCSDVSVENISIINPIQGPNTDGIDLVDSEKITISGCLIETGDDAICLKSQKGPVQYITVTNCILESDDAAIKFGTGSHVATRFCSFDNIVIKNTRYGIALFMQYGGIFENCRFSDMIIRGGSRHANEYPIYIDIDQRSEEFSFGQIRDLTFDNIDIYSGGKVLVHGRPENRIKNLKLSDISFNLITPSDFTGKSKPRGNKTHQHIEGNIDLAPHPSVFSMTYTENLILDQVLIRLQDGPGNRIKGFYIENDLNTQIYNCMDPILGSL